MSFEPRTRTYVERRLTEGKTKAQIMRCLNLDPPIDWGRRGLPIRMKGGHPG